MEAFCKTQSDFLSPNRLALQQTLACQAQPKFPLWVTGCQLENKFQEVDVAPEVQKGHVLKILIKRLSPGAFVVRKTHCEVSLSFSGRSLK